MSGPAIFSVPPHRAFADSLAAGLIDRYGGDPLGLARGLVLLPNNRAVRAMQDAFVRRAEGGLLLPRLAAIGDEALDERLGPMLDPLDDAAPIPPAMEPLARRLILARLVQEAREIAGEPVDAGEAARLAADLARTLDQLHGEEIDPARLRDAVAEADGGGVLALHWERSLAVLELILARWPAELEKAGRIDLAERRNRLLARAAERWTVTPPAGFVVAAGITGSAPAVARLLRTIARLPQGMVVLPGLDRLMPEQEWRALGPHAPDPVTGIAAPSLETHPQYHLKLLLDRMDATREDVRGWRRGSGRDAPAARARAINNAMTPAAFTAKWRTLKPAERRLTGVRAADFAHPAEEAQGIAVAIREALEVPARTVALVTPDRTLARRVVAHLARWNIEADDSAGVPLTATPPGTLLLALAEAVAERFAPVALLALVKHPLVRAGEGRLAWLEGARALDRALRGPRPGPGLAGVTTHLAAARWHVAARWWDGAVPLLAPLESVAPGALGPALALLREAIEVLAGDAAWAGPAGRAMAELFEGLERCAAAGPRTVRADALPSLLKVLMDDVAVRPPQGGHPRVAIYGLIEARLQQADLTILGGLNEGVWPSVPQPDPWLAPAIRRLLGLPGLERRVGLAAHDFALGLGGPRVLVTRARRDARAPTVASRLWLRLEAMTGGITRAPLVCRWARALDPAPERPAYAPRPAPRPPVADRPHRIAVTRLDRLNADPFAFYAQSMLRLGALEAVDADLAAAWRGSAVHKIFEQWIQEDDGDPAALLGRAEALLEGIAAHPVQRALWTPRLMEAVAWVAERMGADAAAGRRPLVAELKGKAQVGEILLEGTVDRIDRLEDGKLAIVDYKTGQPPSKRAVAEGFAMQLGLLGLIAERGGFEGVEGRAAAFEYWSLAQKDGQLGHVARIEPGRDGQGPDPAEMTARAARQIEAAAARWLTGDAPFTALLHPEYAPYGDYDQLARKDEWYGRES
ncbi:double-strand break repair protein AddB [Sphingomonas jatrophae]|uniref:ATP-dependent helicase/nuclease subunit B n=1 Tax=Sphingomonas jatrophae TaxID=1166337 RepID=A0A1I6KYK0_9SPHN|nr:double-strand break repair protein AddB [Sphingomonas jatrophae]SFR96306.1 ATP-dependent helicase/nuclease subunit B [Sphingomonas jatrophae]